MKGELSKETQVDKEILKGVAMKREVKTQPRKMARQQ